MDKSEQYQNGVDKANEYINAQMSKAGFNESKHKRDSSGQFSKGSSGGGSHVSVSEKEKDAIDRRYGWGKHEKAASGDRISTKEMVKRLKSSNK